MLAVLVRARPSAGAASSSCKGGASFAGGSVAASSSTVSDVGSAKVRAAVAVAIGGASVSGDAVVAAEFFVEVLVEEGVLSFFLEKTGTDALRDLISGLAAVLAAGGVATLFGLSTLGTASFLFVLKRDGVEVEIEEDEEDSVDFFFAACSRLKRAARERFGLESVRATVDGPINVLRFAMKNIKNENENENENDN